MPSVKKVLTKREQEEKLRKKLKRNPELNPDSTQNKQCLVTGHYGSRGFLMYHGNNINRARELVSYTGLRKIAGKLPGRIPLVVKLWTCIGRSKEQLSD